jgi:hypothetical protein
LKGAVEEHDAVYQCEVDEGMGFCAGEPDGGVGCEASYSVDYNLGVGGAVEGADEAYYEVCDERDVDGPVCCCYAKGIG